MNPEFVIKCLRCTASEKLVATSATQDSNGTWRPINARRPDNWIAGPAPLKDVASGLCPRCAVDWNKMQEGFLTTPPEDPEVVLRNPITMAPKAVGVLPVTIPPKHSTHIPMQPSNAAPVVSGIPLRAQVSSSAAIQQTARSVPAARVTQSPANLSQVRVSGAAPAATSTVTSKPVETFAVPPTSVQRIVHTPAPTVVATPIGAGPHTPLQSYPAASETPITKKSVVTVSPPEPLRK